MSKERISVAVELSTIKSQLRKDERFSQGVRLYAVYQIKLGRNAEELEELYNVTHVTQEKENRPYKPHNRYLLSVQYTL